MITQLELKRLEIKFLFVISIILCLAYAIFISSVNVFQNYTYVHHIDQSIYAGHTLMSFRLMTFIIALNLLSKFQDMNYQRILISMLIIILLVIPVSLTTYPIISAFSNAVVELAKVWLQLYVPSPVRATFAGALSGAGSLIKIRSTTIEKHWAEAVSHKYIIASIMTVFLFFFWKLTLKFQAIKNIDDSPKLPFESISRLLLNHPYVFFASFVIGFNSAMLYYSFLLGQAALPGQPAQIYQYILYSGGIISPVIIGRIADKYGISLIIIYAIFILTLCKFINVTLAFVHCTNPVYYYIVVFIEAGLASGLPALGISLVGQKMRLNGVFRSFALSSIIINTGILAYNRIYVIFSYSFLSTKMAIGVVNILFLFLLWYFYKQNNQNK